MTGKLAILPGDGVGPEVIAEARRVLDWVLSNRNFALDLTTHDFGLACYAKTGELMTPEMRADVMEADAVLFGAMGGPEYDKIPREVRHRGGVLGLRTGMKVFANLRPAIGFTEIADAVPLKESVIDGVDLLLVREANGGLYVSPPRGIETLEDGQERGVNTMAYTTDEVKRVARVAFRLAEQRSGRLCSVDKSNVLEVSNVWRNAVIAVHRDEFPGIELSHLFVDNCAMQLIRDPRQFDVLVTDNIFGDILSDGSAAIMGSLGMAPSGSLNDPEADGKRRGLYEPVHGSAPDIAGKGIANPIGAIWSLALALEHSFDRSDDAELILRAIRAALGRGARTPDIAGDHKPVGTAEMADAVIAELDRLN